MTRPPSATFYGGHAGCFRDLPAGQRGIANLGLDRVIICVSFEKGTDRGIVAPFHWRWCSADDMCVKR